MTTTPAAVDEMGIRAAATVDAGAAWGASTEPPMTISAMLAAYGDPMTALVEMYSE